MTIGAVPPFTLFVARVLLLVLFMHVAHGIDIILNVLMLELAEKQ